MTSRIDRAAIQAAHDVIRPHVRRTPAVEASGTDFGLAPFRADVQARALQHAGSFKSRGAFANLLLRDDPAGRRGRGLRRQPRRRGGVRGDAPGHAGEDLRADGLLSAKVERIRGYGADLEVGGERYADALAASEAFAARSGALPVHAFDQAETLLGQGTVGAELTEQAPDLETLLVAVGGGGLIGGIAAWYGGAIRDRGGRARGRPDADPRPRGGPAGGRRDGQRRRRLARPAARRAR